VKVSLLVPFTPGRCPHRDAAWAWVRSRYATVFPRWEIVVGEGDTPDGYSRSRGILDAARQATGDVLVVTDADVWCHPGLAVLRAVEDGWAVPHTMIHRLSVESTDKVLAGSPWQGLPLSTDNPQDSKPYRGNETGTLVVLRRDVFDRCPPDPRFVGWGQEDNAWGAALRCLAGPPWRGPDDLVHLWHPPQPRKSRVVGNDRNLALWRRYRNARTNPAAMAALIEEAKCSTNPSRS
jgi:hypothetical protein